MNSPAAATKDVQNRAARRIHDFLTLQQERRQLQEEKDCNETTAPNSSSCSNSSKNSVLQFIQAKRRIRELEEANQELVDRDLQHQNKHLYNVRRILALRKDRCDQKFAIQKLEKTIAELEWKGTEQEQQRKDIQERTRLQISSVETKIQQLEQMVESQTSMVWKLEAENESYKIRRFKDAQTIFYLKNTERSQQKVIAKVRRQMDSMMDAIYVLITHGAGGPNHPHQQLQQHHEEEEEDGDDDDEDNEEDTDEDESVEELVEDNDEDEDDIVEEVVDEEDDDEEEEENEEIGPSEEFTCPLTRDVFVEPVIDAEGNTYERDAILEWLQHNDTSPITRNQLAEHHLVPNRVLKNLIAALAYHHRHSNITTTTTATISSSTTSSSSSTSSSDSSTSSDSL
eukprot:scaffold4199_cov101-Cylindrotheca_fusiformis.AAC.6